MFTECDKEEMYLLALNFRHDLSREATWSPRVTASPLRTVHSATVVFSDPDLAGTYGTDVPERRTKHLRSDDLRDPASIPVGAITPA